MQTKFEDAASAFKKAIALDVSDPNRIQTELDQVLILNEKKEVARLKKMDGFLKNGFGGD